MSVSLFCFLPSPLTNLGYLYSISMPTFTAALLLSSNPDKWVRWVGTWGLVWFPQVLWTGFAALLLTGVLLRLRRIWIRGVFLGVPYLMIGYAVYDELRDALYWSYAYPPRLSVEDVLRDPHFWKNSWPTLLAVPGLLLLHILLVQRRDRRKSSEAYLSGHEKLSAPTQLAD